MLSELRLKNPYLFDVLESLQNSNNRGYVEIDDLGKLLTAFQYDSRIGFSVVSSLRQAIALRENWMEDTCVRGCLCNSPGYRGRNLIRDPPSAAELPNYFESSFSQTVDRLSLHDLRVSLHRNFSLHSRLYYSQLSSCYFFAVVIIFSVFFTATKWPILFLF